LRFGATPQVAEVPRAMLPGDRSFVERDEATNFQKPPALQGSALVSDTNTHPINNLILYRYVSFPTNLLSFMKASPCKRLVLRAGVGAKLAGGQ